MKASISRRLALASAFVGTALLLDSTIIARADPTPVCTYDIADGPLEACTSVTPRFCFRWNNMGHSLCTSGSQDEIKTDFPKYCVATGLNKSCMLVLRDCHRWFDCEYDEETGICSVIFDPNMIWFREYKKETVNCPGGPV